MRFLPGIHPSPLHPVPNQLNLKYESPNDFPTECPKSNPKRFLFARDTNDLVAIARAREEPFQWSGYELLLIYIPSLTLLAVHKPLAHLTVSGPVRLLLLGAVRMVGTVNKTTASIPFFEVTASFAYRESIEIPPRYNFDPCHWATSPFR